MKLLLALIFSLLTIYSFGQSVTEGTKINIDSLLQAKERESLGKPFPGFFAVNEEGNINNDSLAGKVVLINFWFEGCHPCLAEFGAFNELSEKLKGNPDFEFISFTWDNAEIIRRVKEKYKLQFKVFHVTGSECRRLNQNNGYPTTIVLDRKGIIKYLVFGGATDTEKAREFVMTTLLPIIEKEL